MKFLLNKIFISFTIILCIGCTEDPPNTNGDDNNNTIPTTMPQEHIPWPSLADSPWPMYMHDPQHTGRSPYEGPSQGEVNWEFPLGTEMFSNPVVDMNGNIVFTARSDFSGDAKLFSVSSAGNLNWKMELGGLLDSAPLITSDSSVYVTYDRYIAQLDLNGNLRWKYTLGRAFGNTTFSPNISKDGSIIYVCGFDHALHAINRDGTLYWKYIIEPDYSGGEPSISPDGNTIYFVGSDNKLYSINKDGSLNWNIQLDNNGQIISPVIDYDGNIYLYSGRTFYSISPEANIRWQYEGMQPGGGFLHGCTIGPDGTIYATMMWSYHAFDYAGNLKWNMQLQDKYVDLQNIPVVDLMGNTYFGTWFTGPNDEEWYNVNFVSFDSEGSVRYKIHLGSDLLDIDSPGFIDGNGNLYVGSDGRNSAALFSIR